MASTLPGRAVVAGENAAANLLSALEGQGSYWQVIWTFEPFEFLWCGLVSRFMALCPQLQPDRQSSKLCPKGVRGCQPLTPVPMQHIPSLKHILNYLDATAGLCTICSLRVQLQAILSTPAPQMSTSSAAAAAAMPPSAQHDMPRSTQHRC